MWQRRLPPYQWLLLLLARKTRLGGQNSNNGTTTTWGSVCSGDDPISMESWNDIKIRDMPDVVTIRPEIGVSEKGLCTQREDLIRAMESNVVYRWIPNDPREPQYGAADRSKSFYKHPLGWWLDADSLRVIKQLRPRKYSLFQLQFVEEQLVGTEFGVSNLHGALVAVYTLVPLASQTSFHEQVRRGYVASYRRTSFERMAREREESKRRRRLLQEEAMQRRMYEEEAAAAANAADEEPTEREEEPVVVVNPPRRRVRAPRPATRELIKWMRIRRLPIGTDLIMKRGLNERQVRFMGMVPGRAHAIQLTREGGGPATIYIYEAANQNWISQNDQSKWKLYLESPRPRS